MKKILACFVVAVLFLSSIPAIDTFAADFADINQVTWEGAKTYINSVANLNLMVGDNNSAGKRVFRPNDKVSYCETVQLAYNSLKISGKLGETSGLVAKWTGVMSGYKIPSWAYEAIAYALENEFVSIGDVSGFMKSQTEHNYATKEDVAVIFTKAIYSGSLSNGSSLDFADKSSITATAKPYVEYLWGRGIFVGDDKNHFNPKQSINRAQMAVVMSKTYNVITGGKVGNGIDLTGAESITASVVAVEAFGSNMMITLSSNGQQVGFIGDKSVPVFNDGKADNFMNITAGDNITLYYKGAKVLKVIINYDFIKSPTSGGKEGTINLLTSSKITLDLASGDTELYTLESNFVLTLNGKLATVSEVMEVVYNGVNVKASLTINENTGYVSAVKATGETNLIKGTLESISSIKAKIKKTSNNSDTYYFGSISSITFEGAASSINKIAEKLENGQVLSVSATLDDNGYIIKLEVKEESSSGTTGTLKSLSDTSISIVLSNGSSKSYTLRDEPTVMVDGSNSSLYRLQNYLGDTIGDISVVLTLNSSNRVSKISATIEDTVSGYISDVTDTRITLVTVSGTKRFVLADEDDLTIKIDGASRDIDDLMDAVDDNYRVTVKVSFNSYEEVDYITASTSGGSSSSSSDEKGVLVSATTSRIRIKTSDNSYYYYYLADDVDITIDGRTKTINNLITALDDYDKINVTLTLDEYDDVTDIAATTTRGEEISGTLTLISYTRLRLKTSSGSYVYYNLADEDDLYITLNSRSSTIEGLMDAISDYDSVSVDIYINDDDEVTEIDAETDGSDSDANGDLVSVTTSRLRIKSGATYTYYYLADRFTVKVDGVTSSISKLIGYFEADDDIYVYLTINSDDEITKIEAERGGANANSDYSGTVINVTSATMGIRISAASTMSFSFATSPVVKIDGVTKTVTDLYNNWYYGETTYVKITLSNNKITRVEAETQKAEGTLISVSSSILYIKNNGRTKYYDLASSVTVNIDGSSSSVSALKTALSSQSDIEVILTLNDGEVVRISANTW